MNYRALIRRALPYLVIGIGGFALAYVIIFVFVLPSKIVPSPRTGSDHDAAARLHPVDTTTALETTAPETSPRPVTIPMAAPAGGPGLPVDAPDLTGMALNDARAVLNGYRLSTRVERDTSSYQPPNTVLSQRPAAGTHLQPGAAVTLTVSYIPAGRTSDSVRDTTRGIVPAPARRDSTAQTPGRRPLPPIVPTDADTSHPPAP